MRSIKFKAMKTQRLIIVICLAVALGPNQLNAFWLTDGSLFHQPATGNSIKDDQILASSAQPAQLLRSPAITTISGEALERSLPVNQNELATKERREEAPQASNGSGSVSDRPDPKWVRLQVDASSVKPSQTATAIGAENKQVSSVRLFASALRKAMHLRILGVEIVKFENFCCFMARATRLPKRFEHFLMQGIAVY